MKFRFLLFFSTFVLNTSAAIAESQEILPSKSLSWELYSNLNSLLGQRPNLEIDYRADRWAIGIAGYNYTDINSRSDTDVGIRFTLYEKPKFESSSFLSLLYTKSTNLQFYGPTPGLVAATENQDVITGEWGKRWYGDLFEFSIGLTISDNLWSNYNQTATPLVNPPQNTSAIYTGLAFRIGCYLP